MSRSPAWTSGDGHLYPTPIQHDLILAAITSGAASVEHFERWRTQLNIEEPFEWQMTRLLPLVYRRLLDAGYTDPLMPRLKGVYRKSWAEVQQHRDHAAQAIAILAAGQISVLLIKGLALGEHVYGQVAARPMSDIDMVVRAKDTRQALALLQAAGWTLGWQWRPEKSEWFHAQQLFHPDGGELDLHWRVMVEATTPDAEDALWSQVLPTTYAGHPVGILDPAAQLVHTVVHGMRWNPASPMRWIVDASELLARTTALDWSRVLQLAELLRVGLRLERGLQLLAERYAQPVPTEVLRAVRALPIRWRERIEARVLLADQRHWSTQLRFRYWGLFGDFVRVFDDKGSARALLWAFPRYIVFRMDLGGRRDLLRVAWRGVLRRLRWPSRAPTGGDAPAPANNVMP